MLDLTKKKRQELEKILTKAENSKRILHRKRKETARKVWDYKCSEDKLWWFIQYCRREIGRRKATRCGVLQKHVLPSWGPSYSCGAKDTLLFRRVENLYEKVCYKCKWTPAQAKVRKVLLKLRGRRHG